MIQIFMFDADAGKGVLIALTCSKSCCSPRRKKSETSIHTYHWGLFFLSVGQTEKLVNLELSCQDPTFRQDREFSKELAEGIILCKTHFLNSFFKKKSSIKWRRICSYPMKSREGLIHQYRKFWVFFFIKLFFFSSQLHHDFAICRLSLTRIQP